MNMPTLPLPKKALIALLVVLAFAACGALFHAYTEDKAVPIEEVQEEASMPTKSDAKTEPTATEAIVYVSGEVVRPGVYHLTPEARAEKAIAAAGGFLPEADAASINLASKVQDGMQIHVPNKQENASGTGAASGNGTHKGDKIHINRADEKTLDELPGIGPAMAKRIVDYRNTHGPFQAIEDLKKVRGIGEAKFEQMKDMIAL